MVTQTLNKVVTDNISQCQVGLAVQHCQLGLIDALNDSQFSAGGRAVKPSLDQLDLARAPGLVVPRLQYA
jgi:hypothetical protein